MNFELKCNLCTLMYSNIYITIQLCTSFVSFNYVMHLATYNLVNEIFKASGSYVAII